MLSSIMRYSDPFIRLKHSSYRRDLHLNEMEAKIVLTNGFTEIVDVCQDMVEELQDPHHSHRDTPLRGVIPKARHATATCCRKCLFNWHRIPRYRPLTDAERLYILRLVLRWIKKEVLCEKTAGYRSKQIIGNAI